MIGTGAVVAQTAPTLEPLNAATGIFGYIWLLIALPLAGAIILLTTGRLLQRWGHLLAVALVSAAARR